MRRNTVPVEKSQGDLIRERVKANVLSQNWLVQNLRFHKGITTDKTELSAVLSGTRKGLKADAILKCSKELLDEYEATK